MKKIMNNVRNTITMKSLMLRQKLREQKAEGYVDTAVKILMAVVIGALLLAGLCPVRRHGHAYPDPPYSGNVQLRRVIPWQR